MYGHHYRIIDDKKRVILPKVIRKSLGQCFYGSIGPDNVLELRDKKSFSIWKEKLISTNMLNENARKFTRILLGNTIEIKLDNQNRMLIPENFINLTKLTKQVAFVGVGNKVELWSKEIFDGFQKENQKKGTLENLAKKLMEDGVAI